MISFILSLFNVLMVTKEVDVMYCDIKGNVKNPGVYLVKDGDVINDIIEKAGGVKKNSYLNNINLSKKVTDEMVIEILSIDEYKKMTYKCPICKCSPIVCNDVITTSELITTNQIILKEEIKSTMETTKVIESTKNDVVSTTKEVVNTTSSTEKITTTTVGETLLININTATMEELLQLSGIGESKAKAIIEYREENGKFTFVEDIKNVKGIGDTLFEKIEKYITI